MKTIALIEDNIDVLESTKEILELADYKVITSTNGMKGIEMVKKEKPDMIFCDISIPDVDGYAILQILKNNSNTSSIPFVFLTAHSEKSDVRKGMNLGADDYITKPFEESEILEAIEARLYKNDKHGEDTQFGNSNYSGFINEEIGLKKIKELLKDRKIKSYKKKETIFREDDYANYLYYINKGKVKCIRTDAYSKEFVIDIRAKGEFLSYNALLEEGDYGETAKVMEAAEVMVIPKKDFLSLFWESKDVAAQFIRQMMNDLRNREERMLQLAYSPVRERLAWALLMLKSKTLNGDTPSSKMLISREDLACIVGTAKESLIRSLSELKTEQFIDTDGQEIQILDEEGLQSLIKKI